MDGVWTMAGHSDYDSQKQFWTAEVIRLERILLSGNVLAEAVLQDIPDMYLKISPLLLKACGDLNVHQGHLTKAKLYYEQAIKGFASQTFQKELLSALAGLACVHLRTGELQEAATIIQFLSEEWTRGEVVVTGQVPYALAQGAFLLNETDRDLTYYRSAAEAFFREQDSRSGCAVLLDMLLACGHRFAAAEWEETLLVIQQKARLNAACSSIVHASEIVRCFDLKQWNRVEKLISELKTEQLSYQQTVGLQLLSVRAELYQHHKADETRLDPVIRYCLKDEADLVHQYNVLCIQFEYKLIKGHTQEADQYLQKAAAFCKLVPPNDQMIEITNMEIKLRLQMQSRQEKARIVSPPPDPASKFPFIIHCFGKMRFVSGNKEIGEIHWKRKKAQELLLYLLLQPHYSAVKEQVTEALFESVEQDKVANQLYVTLHQLKQTLKEYFGVADALIIKDGVIRLRDGWIEYVDVERYLTLIRVGNQLSAHDRKLSVEFYEEAYQMYGELIPEMRYLDWVDRFRLHLEEKQAAILGRLGHDAMDQAEYGQAEVYYREWLRLCPIDEQAYQELIRALLVMGKHTEAKQLYRKLEQMCREELGTAPMAESVQLMTRMMSL